MPSRTSSRGPSGTCSRARAAGVSPNWDTDLLGPELKELQGLDFDLALTGFDDREIDDFLADPGLDDRANLVPTAPEHPVSEARRSVALGPPPGIVRGCDEPE